MTVFLDDEGCINRGTRPLRMKTLNSIRNSFVYLFNSKGTMVFQFISLTEKSFRMASYTVVVVKFVISMVEEAGSGEIPEKF